MSALKEFVENNAVLILGKPTC